VSFPQKCREGIKGASNARRDEARIAALGSRTAFPGDEAVAGIRGLSLEPVSFGRLGIRQDNVPCAAPRLRFCLASLGIGEWEVRGDARAETCFHLRAGITSVMPWLVESGGGSLERRDRGPLRLPLLGESGSGADGRNCNLCLLAASKHDALAKLRLVAQALVRSVLAITRMRLLER
jgi:hypothetical protein